MLAMQFSFFFCCCGHEGSVTLRRRTKVKPKMAKLRVKVKWTKRVVWDGKQWDGTLRGNVLVWWKDFRWEESACLVFRGRIQVWIVLGRPEVFREKWHPTCFWIDQVVIGNYQRYHPFWKCQGNVLLNHWILNREKLTFCSNETN